MPNIIFFGTSEFAIPALNLLMANGLSPIALVTAPDKPAGRGRKLLAPPVKRMSNIRYLTLQPSILDASFIGHIAVLKPDLGIVASYGKILPKELLALFPQGVLNIHPSLLPSYRGPSPIQTTIRNGDRETGVTIMLVDERMDHGSILAQEKFTGEVTALSHITYQELHDALAKLGAELLTETLPKWIAGKIKPVPQDESRATYTTRIKKEDGKIDWPGDAEYIERMVRAYNPWPGTYLKMKNGKILKIKKAAVIDGVLQLLIVQPEGKKEMKGDAFLRGHKNFAIL